VHQVGKRGLHSTKMHGQQYIKNHEIQSSSIVEGMQPGYFTDNISTAVIIIKNIQHKSVLSHPAIQEHPGIKI